MSNDRTPVPAKFRQERAASPKQLAFILSLANERVMEDEHRTALIARVEAEDITMTRASDFIERLLKLPKVQGDIGRNLAAGTGHGADSVPSPEALPAGRYAVESAEGELTFYHLWRGTRNPSYVKLFLQHGQDETEIPFGKGLFTILKSIVEANPFDAAVRYGREIGACSICGKRLTNRLSRELGIGPVCGGRFFEGSDWKSRKAAARDDIRQRGEDPNEDVDAPDYSAPLYEEEREYRDDFIPCMGCGGHDDHNGECQR